MPRPTRTLTAGLTTALTAAVLVAAPASAAPPVETIPLPDASSPEGIAGGPGSTFYAGSRADGSIYSGDLRTGDGAILVAGENGGVAVGMQYDPRTRLLWVAGGPTGRVSAYDGRTGELVVRYTAPESANGRFLNDVDVTKDGVFVTDSLNAELVVVPTGRGNAPLPADVELLPLTGDWDQGPGFNANGIREVRGGDLLVVDSGELLTVDADTGVATELTQTGGEELTGGDGLELRGNTLYAVYGFSRDSVAEVRLDLDAGTYRTTGELTDDDLERPTTGTVTANAIYTVNGKFNTVDATTFEVVRVALR